MNLNELEQRIVKIEVELSLLSERIIDFRTGQLEINNQIINILGKQRTVIGEFGDAKAHAPVQKS